MAVACIWQLEIAMSKIYIFLVLVGVLTYGYQTAEIKEYCIGEWFRATCANDEVVVMKTSVYGRMKKGKCIDQDLGFLGCSENALRQLDNACSNKNSCEMIVIELSVITTCPKDVTSYLEATFDCIKVLQFQCSDKPVLLTQDTMISSETLKQCGSSSITFSAKPGQHLNISVLYFDWDETDSSTCRRHYGNIKDSISSNSAQLCSGRNREKYVMISNGNSVGISLGSGVTTGSFLLQISILGCGDVDAPPGGWVQRDDDELIMGCHSGKHTWTLQCVDNQWQGVTGQCGTDTALAFSKPEEEQTEFWGLSPGILVFAVCSILMFLSAVMFTLGVCIHVNRSDPAPDLSKVPLYEGHNQRFTMQPRHFDTQRSLQGSLLM